MLSLVGYNFCGDINCLDELPTNVNNITKTRIQNGIYDHINILGEADSAYSTAIPDSWGFDTILDCNFKNNISGGNIGELAQYITEFRIKRRVKGTYDWITIKDEYINDPSELSVIFKDNLALNYTEYEYAFVPIMNDAEGNYVIEDVLSKFNGVYICDINTIYKFYAGVEYGDTDRVQQVGVFAPFGSKYPVVISNGLIDYHTGSINGYILPNDNEFMNFTDDMRYAMVKRRNEITEFLVNKEPKIVKDWNGNAWLLVVVDNVNASYVQESGNALTKVNFTWNEIGNVHSNDDLKETVYSGVELETISQEEENPNELKS